MNPFSDDAAAPAEERGEGKMKQAEEEKKGKGKEGEKRQVEQKDEEKEKRQKEWKEWKEQAMEPAGIENRYQRLKGSKGRQNPPTAVRENGQECNKKEEKKEKGGGKNKKALALKSTNQRLRQPTPPKQPPPEFEVAIPAERLSPVLIAKRTRPAGAHGKPEAVRPQKPNNRNKFRRASPSSVPLRRLSAGIGMGISMLSSPFGSPAAAAAAPAAVPAQPKTREKGARCPTAGGVGGPAPAMQVIPIGDVDQVINPHNAPVEAALLGSSPPAMAWLKVKASGVVSGARKAADRLLKTRVGGSSSSSKAKGYALLDEEPPTLSKENMRVQQANLKIRSNNGSKKQLDTRVALPTIEENSFGELIDNDTSFSSFLLGDGEDELSLPNGSYVVNYDNGDTVITAAVTQLEDCGKEDAEPLSESPLAQFTPGVGWDLKRKKSVEFLKGRPSGVIDGGRVDSPSGRPGLSVVTEADDELLSGHYNHISGEHGLQPRPRNTQGGKRVVKKMAMEDLRNPAAPVARAGAGAIKVYGRKKASRIHSRSLDGFGVDRKEPHGRSGDA